ASGAGPAPGAAPGSPAGAAPSGTGPASGAATPGAPASVRVPPRAIVPLRPSTSSGASCDPHAVSVVTATATAATHRARRVILRGPACVLAVIRTAVLPPGPYGPPCRNRTRCTTRRRAKGHARAAPSRPGLGEVRMAEQPGESAGVHQDSASPGPDQPGPDRGHQPGGGAADVGEVEQHPLGAGDELDGLPHGRHHGLVPLAHVIVVEAQGGRLEAAAHLHEHVTDALPRGGQRAWYDHVHLGGPQTTD